jgi:hypothetical protein
VPEKALSDLFPPGAPLSAGVATPFIATLSKQFQFCLG